MDYKDLGRSTILGTPIRIISNKFNVLPLALISGLFTTNAFAQQPDCSLEVTNQWGSGSQVSVTVGNQSGSMIEDWHVEITYSSGSVIQSWSSSRQGNNPALFGPPGWKTTLAPSEQFNFGFIANHGGGFEVPDITACYAGSEPIPDSDSDGVEDGLDNCPQTPDAESVDSNGCGWSQLDEDSDGVLNPVDSCPNTPASDTANSSGCGAAQIDDDSDGVVNASDSCPNTPSTDTADSNGCGATQLDDDSDGVVNASDYCPNTPATDSADANGCGQTQLDDDSDGVVNSDDSCPNTPVTDSADANGCGQTQLDDDSDGVMNASDTCPNTPSIDSADANGCGQTQLDDDADGVMNASDTCPNTPTTDSADANGCGATQLDDDADGVVNSNDSCPDTPASDLADANGCGQTQLDEDNDGVANAYDICPATPVNEPVDGAGCSVGQLDDDGDGVVNAQDQCPNTPSTQPADTSGCSWTQLDDDEDGVDNSLDLCPGTMPAMAVDANGCADNQRDSDSDGVWDIEDLCPETTSPYVTPYGCDPGGDEDGDFIPNQEDLCPFSHGLMQLRGCKSSFGDFDSDGVTDNLDECPYTIHPDAIRPEYFPPKEMDNTSESGCTFSDNEDFDGDGVIWAEDVCALPNPFKESYAIDRKGCGELENKDDDGDGVINGLDACPHDFGNPRLNGCVEFFGHDIDNDGLANHDDICPFSPDAGEISANGCRFWIVDDQPRIAEDLDFDGLNDDMDECWHTPLGHQVDGMGCTPLQRQATLDSDEDGVSDAWDQCPDSPLLHFSETTAYGCNTFTSTEDHDRDGIPDSLDRCVDEPGLEIHQGCANVFTQIESNNPSHNNGQDDPLFMDRDQDTVPDREDECPYSRVYYAPEMPPIGNHFGCLSEDLLDSDYDGVIDGKDRCPRTEISQVVDQQGCNDFERLDLDADGLINGEDLCPYQPGYWKLNGCGLSASDSDQDGVPNELDQCPLSLSSSFGPRGPVDPETGCAEFDFKDNDQDGVENLEDRCPHTALGEYVLTHWSSFDDTLIGCSQKDLDALNDEDSDGVTDDFDHCLGTPTGESVDQHGCFNPEENDDTDGDFVPNDFDECPETFPGTPVDHNGCSIFTPVRLVTPLLFSHASAELPAGPESEILIDLHENDRLAFSDYIVGHSVSIEVGPYLWEQFVNVHEEMTSDRLIVWVDEVLRNKAIHIPVRVHIENTNITSPWSEIIIRPQGLSGSNTPLGSIIVNDPQILQHADIRLRDVFEMLNPGDPAKAVSLFKQFWASQRSDTQSISPFTCDFGMGIYPVVCDRPETQIAFLSDFEAEMELDKYQLTAIVNVIEKRHRPWQDCGEQRMVFSLPNDPRGRMFLNFEARIENPMPGDVEGCRPIVEFWQNLPEFPVFEQGMRLRDAFVTEFNMLGYPVIFPEYFRGGEVSGQIRSNQFTGGEWLFREHRLVNTCGPFYCGEYIETVPTSDNPFGPLFNPQLPFEPSQLGMDAAEFQDDFIMNTAPDLISDQFADIRFETAPAFNQLQSFVGGPETMDSDYLMHFMSGMGPSPFIDQLNDLVNFSNARNADGSPLVAEQVIARATGMSCAGCHNPEAFGLTEPGAIGSMSLPDGRIINSWPRSFDFVHIDEQGNLSPAMHEVFLPVRQKDFDGVLQELHSF